MLAGAEVPESDELIALMGERADVKAEEVRRACKILGVEIWIIFGADDAILLVTPEIVRQLARLLRELRPDIVLTHFPARGRRPRQPACGGRRADGAPCHPACRQRRSRRPPLAAPGRADLLLWRGRGLATEHGLGRRAAFYNDVFIDITDVVDKKLAAMDCLESQGYGGAYARKRIETSDGAFGTAAAAPMPRDLSRPRPRRTTTYR